MSDLRPDVRSDALPSPKRAADPGLVPYPPLLAAHYRRLGLWAGLTLWDRLQRQVELRPKAIALLDRRGSLSYRGLHDRAQALARGLHQLGIGPRDPVLVQLPNSITLFEVYFALFRLGAYPIATQLAHRRHELRTIANRAQARAHIVVARHGRFDLSELGRALRADCPSLRTTLVVDDPSADFDGLYTVQCDLPSPPVSREIALLQLSGGSTAVPKLIARTHDDYDYSIRRSTEVCGFTADTVYLAALPVTHNFPLSSPGALGALHVGGRVVLAEQPQPLVTFPLIQRERVTVTALVPGLLPVWLNAAKRKRAAIESLRMMQIGGAPLAPSVGRQVAPTLGCKLQQVFGMAEGLVCYTDPGEALETVVQYQGHPMSEFDEIRVVDDGDEPVAPGEAGHLLTRGPYTIVGYYAAPEVQSAAFTADGFYRTGDRVLRRPDGGLQVVGRAKDQINRGGEKIAAPEVEALLSTHPAVVEAVLVGVEDDFLGERSYAFVVLSNDVEPAELRAHLQRQGLADYKLPDRIEPAESLPRTPIGKVDKHALRARYALVGTGTAAAGPKHTHLTPSESSNDNSSSR